MRPELVKARNAFVACETILEELQAEGDDWGYDHWVGGMQILPDGRSSDPALSDEFLRTWEKRPPYSEEKKFLNWPDVDGKSYEDSFEVCLTYIRAELPPMLLAEGLKLVDEALESVKSGNARSNKLFQLYLTALRNDGIKPVSTQST